MLIASDKYGPLLFQPAEQTNLPGLTELQMHKAHAPFGDIIKYCLSSECFSIYYFHLNITEEITLHFASDPLALLSINLCLEGTMFWTCNSREIILRKGQYFTHNAAIETISLVCLPDANHRFFTIRYSPAILLQLGKQSSELHRLLTGKLKATAKQDDRHTGYLAIHFLQILTRDHYQKIPHNLLLPWLNNQLVGFFIQLLADLFNHAIPPAKSTRLDDICRQAHDFILQNISQHFTINQLARHFHINELYLKTRFKKNYGTGLYEFLQQQRMNYARHLLLTTDMPIKDTMTLYSASKQGLPKGTLRHVTRNCLINLFRCVAFTSRYLLRLQAMISL